MNVIKTIRKLAKTNYYQSLYSNAKEIGLKLFRNEVDYSKNQVMFLQYLSFYNNLNMDIYMKEVDKIVLENDIYEDAWTFYKNKQAEKDKFIKEPIKETHKGKSGGKGFSWLMK